MTHNISSSVFQKRRDALFDKMLPNSVAITKSGETITKSEDQDYPFTPNHYFYYLVGLEESQAIAVLIKDADGGQKFILLTVPDDAQAAQWDGERIGLDKAVQICGADQAYPVSEFATHLVSWVNNRQAVYTIWPMPNDLQQTLNNTLVWLKHRSRGGWQQPKALHNLTNLIDDMRLIKDSSEVEATRRAIQASIAGHQAIMQTCQPGVTEYQLRAQFMHAILWHGCQEEAYPSIVAAGSNACVLHYVDCSATTQDGQLLLTDAGGRYQHYCADLTRTIPVNGQFTSEQRAIYDLVLSVQTQVIEAVRPGAIWRDLHQLSVRLITEGLVDLGLLTGKVQELIDNEAYKTFYMHYIGHWLGLDTHDVGRYKLGNQWRELEPGMLLTTEPGIYIRPDDSIDSKWWHIGVRIEDNILVNDTGYEVLSADLPKQPDDIEQLVQQGHQYAN